MEALAHLWEWLTDWFIDPRFLAALPAFVVSLLIDAGWKKAATCAVFAFYLTPLMMWQFSIPIQGAPGVGVIIAVMGVHGIVERVRGANLKSVIESLWKPK